MQPMTDEAIRELAKGNPSPETCSRDPQGIMMPVSSGTAESHPPTHPTSRRKPAASWPWCGPCDRGQRTCAGFLPET